MSVTYNSEFWRQRVDEARDLAGRMNDAEAKQAMLRVLGEYERVLLQRLHDEAGVAFDNVRHALREKIGIASKDELAALNATVDETWMILQKAREALDAKIRDHSAALTTSFADFEPSPTKPQPSH